MEDWQLMLNTLSSLNIEIIIIIIMFVVKCMTIEPS